MIPMRTLICMAFFASGAGAGSLQDAWEQMLQAHPAVKAAEARMSSKEAGLAAVKATRLPKVDASATYQYNTELARTRLEIPALAPGMQPISRELTVGDHDRMELGVTATYPLFTGFAQTNQIAANDYWVKAARKEIDQVRNQLGFQFGMLHLGIRLAEVEARLRASRLEAWRAHVKTLETQVNSGVATSAQLYAARAEFARTTADTAATRRTLDSLAAEFFALTGIAYHYEDTTRYTFAGEAVAGQSLAAEALDIQAQGLQKAGDAATSSRYPTVNTFAGYRYGNPGINQGMNEWMGYGIFGVQAQWNVFDGFERKSTRVRFASDAQVLQAEAERIRKTQSSALATLQVERTAMEAEKLALLAGLEASQQARLAYKASFGNGVALADDVLDSEIRVADFEARLAQWDVRKAILDLRMSWIFGKPIQLKEVGQ